MPAKKSKKNAITFYIETTLIPEKQREGHQFRNSIAALIPEATQRYKNLPPHEKQRYEQMAREHREKNKTTVDDTRRDNSGNLIAERRDPRQMMLQKRKEDRKLMRGTFHTVDALLERKFYVIGFEYMLEVQKSGDDVEYMPVELGLVEWSMRSGISREFYRMINPGDIPLGYRFKFKEHAEETHRFTMEQIGEGDSNYRSVWMQLENFVQPDATAGNIRVVYCMEHENEKIQGCLRWLHEHAMCGGPNRFRVRFLEDLALELFAFMDKNPSESSIRDMLTTTSFDYEPNTRCKYHEESDTLHCALGAAKRFTFAMSDSLSTVYKYQLTPNHVPTRSLAKQKYVTIGPNQEQLVPDLRGLSAGRGYSVDTGPFASRDIRYQPGDIVGAGPASSGGAGPSEPLIPRARGAVPNASVGLRPPPATRLPAPAFTAGVQEGIRQMSVSQSAPQLNPPRPVMPNVNYPRPAAPVAGQPLAAPVNRPPSAGDPARPPIRPPPMTGPVPPATRPPAAWRNPTPVAAAQAYPAPASSTTFYTPGRDYDSDDDSLDISSMMSGATDTSSYLPSYGGGGFPSGLGRGGTQFRAAAAPSEVSVGSSSFSYRSATCPSMHDDEAFPPVGRGAGLGRGQMILQSGIGRSASISSDRSVAPPPGFSGTNGYM